jgi:hypothetical protein
VNVALATGNIGRPGGGCVRMGGHQEGYSRPSDAHVGRPAAYVDQLLIEGKGGVHHIWGCDHYKTTLNALKFKQAYKKRTDLVKDAMSTVPAGDRTAMVNVIMDAIKKGGLFAVDVDIVPTKIGQACHVLLPAATSDRPLCESRFVSVHDWPGSRHSLKIRLASYMRRVVISTATRNGHFQIRPDVIGSDALSGRHLSRQH